MVKKAFQEKLKDVFIAECTTEVDAKRLVPLLSYYVL